MDPIVGTILMWAGSWAPVGWLLCQGQLLSVSQYQMLFSIIGTAYGGDGRTNFALPSLQGSVPIGAGQAQTGTYRIGSQGGASIQSMALSVNNLPSHNHGLSSATATIPASNVDLSMTVSVDTGQHNIPQQDDYLGAPEYTNRPVSLYRDDATNNVQVSGLAGSVPAQQADISGTVENTGLGQPVQFSNMQPYLAVNFIIAYDGLYPQRP